MKPQPCGLQTTRETIARSCRYSPKGRPSGVFSTTRGVLWSYRGSYVDLREHALFVSVSVSPIRWESWPSPLCYISPSSSSLQSRCVISWNPKCSTRPCLKRSTLPSKWCSFIWRKLCFTLRTRALTWSLMSAKAVMRNHRLLVYPRCHWRNSSLDWRPFVSSWESLRDRRATATSPTPLIRLYTCVKRRWSRVTSGDSYVNWSVLSTYVSRSMSLCFWFRRHHLDTIRCILVTCYFARLCSCDVS